MFFENFPRSPSNRNRQVRKRSDRMAVVKNEIEAKGATVAQAEAEKFAPKAAVTEGRKNREGLDPGRPRRNRRHARQQAAGTERY